MTEKEILDISKPIIDSIDMAAGKPLSTIVKILKGPWESYMIWRIYKFIEYQKNDEITDQEINNFINNMNVDEREIFITLIQKTLQSPSDIELYLLAKINAYLLKNRRLDYFHASLLNAISIMNELDYDNLYKSVIGNFNKTTLVITGPDFESINYRDMLEESVCFLTNEEELNHAINSLIQKLLSVGFIIQANVIGEGTIQLEDGKYKSISFLRTQNFITLFDYVKNYYENWSSE